MGMAASQARYLVLSARKTNIEYEGQQINQSRLALSNQSANLFNQMLGMTVPTAPDSSEFNKLQYSWSDGNNSSVIEKYYQIADSDSDYNYVVTSYHNENVYTGSRKLLSDPQVQATRTNHYSYDATKDKTNVTVKAIVTPAQAGSDKYVITDSNANTYTFVPVDNTNTSQRNQINTLTGTDYDADKFVYDATNKKYTYNALTDYTLVDTTDATQKSALIKVYGSDYDKSASFYVSAAGDYVNGSEIDSAQKSATHATAKIRANNSATVYYTDGTNFVLQSDLASMGIGKSLPLYTVENAPTFSNYTAVGTSNLTAITTDAYKKDSDISTEIEQIVKDMKGTNGSTVAAENLAKCFDSTTGEYLGGIYSFTKNGVTYYTTETDLATSAKSAYSTTSSASNGIDSQQEKLAYYKAAYISTKKEETKKALLETDSSGRFSTAKFEDDSTVYTLSVETVSDTAAYNDAMNEYYYNQKVYDKAIADINAKTELIQQQDKELELKLEQLNTEQSALQNEMESVKKVVDKHVELGFKTFGG